MESRDETRKNKNALMHIWNAFLYSLDGISAAFRNETAFRLEVVLAFILVPTALLLPSNGTGKALMLASVLFVLIVELVNSAIEAAVDRISPDYHPLAKRAKDLGSAAVLVSLLSAPVIWGLVLFG